MNSLERRIFDAICIVWPNGKAVGEPRPEVIALAQRVAVEFHFEIDTLAAQVAIVAGVLNSQGIDPGGTKAADAYSEVIRNAMTRLQREEEEPKEKS